MFIKAAGLKLASGNLLQVLDSNNIPYIIPVFVIHDPVAYKTEKSTNLSKNFAHKTLSLKIRPMGSNIKDKEVSVSSEKTVRELKENYVEGSD
jgi:hypothetical protein